MSHSVWLVVCLVTGVKQTNNWILLHSIPANSVEHSNLNSRMPKFHQNKRHWNKKIAGLPAKFYSTRFLQELGGH